MLEHIILNLQQYRNEGMDIMKYSICIDSVFKGKDFIVGMETVKNTGFEAFEFWGWWNKDIDAILQKNKELKLQIAAFCTQFISLVDSSKHDEYIKSLYDSIEIAKRLECKTIITQVGDKVPGSSDQKLHLNLVEGLAKCAQVLKNEDITLVFEPLNTATNHKDYFLWSSDEAFKIEKEVGSKNIKVLYDIYHQQIMEGNLITRITSNIEKIGHFHAAGNPGRNELFYGEINYKEVLMAIGNSGYEGIVGLEYLPRQDAHDGLIKLRDFLR